MPRQVRIACVLAWVFSALTGGAYLVAILVIAVDRSRALELLRDNATVQNTSLSDRELIGLVIAVSAVVIAWSILAAVFAALTWRRQPVARALLLVSAAGAFLTEMVGLPYTLAHVAASAATFVLLLSPAARTWFAQDRSPGLPPSPGAWPAPDPRASDQQPTASTEERPAGKPPVW